MDVTSLNTDLSGGCVEILELQLTNLTSIHRVGIVGAEFLNIELHDASADLLVGSESDLDLTMLEIRMFHDVLDSIHDLGDPAFVVSSQKGGAIGRDKGLAYVMEHLGEFRRL